MPHGYRQSNARLVWLMCPHLSANYVADCPPNMAQVSVYKDERTGKRLAVYSPDLAELRKKEKEINKDMDEGILTDTDFRSMTLNDLFQIHLETTKLAESTKKNYCRMWESLVKNDLGQMKVVQVRPSQL